MPSTRLYSHAATGVLHIVSATVLQPWPTPVRRLMRRAGRPGTGWWGGSWLRADFLVGLTGSG